MLKTRVCELLNIEHPIVQASMAWVNSAEMAAAALDRQKSCHIESVCSKTGNMKGAIQSSCRKS